MPPSFKGCCVHDHDCEAADCGPSWSLYKHIDLHKVRCLNESEEGSCKRVFKPWAQRLDFSTAPLESNEDDPELLIHVPFDGQVVLKAICVIGGTDGTSPSRLKVFTNRDDLDFGGAADMAPTQEWELVENLNGAIEYPTQVTKFNGVYSLDLYIPDCFGADRTRIHFIGLKGEYQQVKREAVNAVYEARPVPKDHKVPGIDQGSAWGTGT